MNFEGTIPSSKSLFNRALIVQSFFSELKLIGSSECQDVLGMKNALKQFFALDEVDCGDAGTVIRFLSFRASRKHGVHRFKGSDRLLARPLKEIQFVLDQLGVNCQINKSGMTLISEGWKRPIGAVRVHRDQSSQFASGLLLSSWNLGFDLEIETLGNLSDDYFHMTQHLCETLGMQMIKSKNKIRIPAGQKLKTQEYSIEPDYSSAFAVVAAAVLSGRCDLLHMPSSIVQPDFVFIDILKKMNASVDLKDFVLSASKASVLKAVNVNLENSPDLFPVLAVLCGLAQGTSKLFGAPHLALKESNRIQKTFELLTKAGIKSQIVDGGLIIEGSNMKIHSKAFSFDPDHDHRMAMAAALLNMVGAKIQILNKEVVNKSFPEFWSIVGVQ